MSPLAWLIRTCTHVCKHVHVARGWAWRSFEGICGSPSQMAARRLAWRNAPPLATMNTLPARSCRAAPASVCAMRSVLVCVPVCECANVRLSVCASVLPGWLAAYLAALRPWRAGARPFLGARAPGKSAGDCEPTSHAHTLGSIHLLGTLAFTFF